MILLLKQSESNITAFSRQTDEVHLSKKYTQDLLLPIFPSLSERATVNPCTSHSETLQYIHSPQLLSAVSTHYDQDSETA